MGRITAVVNRSIHHLMLRYLGRWGDWFEEMGMKTEAENPGTNDKYDAFRHVFCSAMLMIRLHSDVARHLPKRDTEKTIKTIELFANFIGYELKIMNERMKKATSDRNMDLWNNQVGREIGAQYLRDVLSGKTDIPTMNNRKLVEKYIAELTKAKLQSGACILDPEQDGRRYNSFFQGNEFSAAQQLPGELKALLNKMEREGGPPIRG